MAFPLLATSVVARPIKSSPAPAPGTSWLNGEVRQLVRGTLMTGTSPRAMAVTASDLKDSNSISPFAAMNAGLDPVSSDCLCLRPGNPALNGRGSLGRSRISSSSGGGGASKQSVLQAAAHAVEQVLSASEPVVGAEALDGTVRGSRFYEPAPFALASPEADHNSAGEAQLSLASPRDSGRIAGASMFGGTGVGAFSGGGFGSSSQSNGAAPYLATAASGDPGASDTGLSLGVYEQAGSPDSGAIRMAVLDNGGLAPVERQWLARLDSDSQGYSAAQQEMMANSVRFYTALSKDASGDAAGEASSRSSDFGSSSAASSATAGFTAQSATASHAATFEPELAKQITATLADFSAARTSAPAASSKGAELALLQTTASGSDVLISLSAPGAAEGDQLTIAALDDVSGVNAAAVPEPSNLAMALVAVALLAVGSLGTRKAS